MNNNNPKLTSEEALKLIFAIQGLEEVNHPVSQPDPLSTVDPEGSRQDAIVIDLLQEALDAYNIPTINHGEALEDESID